MEALHIRERYMRVSHQSFPTITSRFFHKKHPRTQEDPSSPLSSSVLQSSDSSTDVTASGTNKSEIRQPYPRARVIKHEDRQSIAGEFFAKITYNVYKYNTIDNGKKRKKINEIYTDTQFRNNNFTLLLSLDILRNRNKRYIGGGG